MGAAKVISMVAQPALASDLCFEIGGILDTRMELGQEVSAAVDYQGLCEMLKTSTLKPGTTSRLFCDSKGFMSIVGHFSVGSLRNEDRKAVLDSAVNARENIHYSKYADSQSVIATIRAYYSADSPGSKSQRLDSLREIAEQQASELQSAYSEDGVSVVRSTNSLIRSQTSSDGSSNRYGLFNQESIPVALSRDTLLPHQLPQPENKDKLFAFKFPVSRGERAVYTIGRTYEGSDNIGHASGDQQATHQDYEYKIPTLDAAARNNRAQISLMDQRFEAFMFERITPKLEKIFKNELDSIDNDVYQIQIALLKSFITSPIPGIVTGVFKNPGEAVAAGEPVIRIEDSTDVQMVANLVHHAHIGIGALATISTTLGPKSTTVTLTGNVVAARGQGNGARWEVVINAKNHDSSGNILLPLGYCFDPEYTEVTIA